MIKINNSKGSIRITGAYLAALSGIAAQSCFGVADMADANTGDTLKTIVFGKNYTDKGVRVVESDGKLFIELHITVIYGLNISAIVKSIINKVRYTVEQATDIPVEEVTVVVENVKDE